MTVSIFWFASPDPVVYQDDVVSIVEGLKEMNVCVSGSRDYWKMNLEGGYLLTVDPGLSPDKADIVVCSWSWLRSYSNDCKIEERELPDYFQTKNPNQKWVLFDLDDGYCTPSFGDRGKCFDLVFRSKFNRRLYHPPNQRPWSLGLTNRVLNALPSEPIPFQKRHDVSLSNFGASHGYEHGSRKQFAGRFNQAVKQFLEVDTTKDDLSQAPQDSLERLMWEQTQHRHCNDYYRRLANSKVIAAFCGELIPPGPYRPTYLVGGRKAAIKRRLYELASLFDPRAMRSVQWDSWRFWEGLAAGCLVFNIDLEYYGVDLPVMPVNGEHYIGLRHDRIERDVAAILSEPDRMEQIALNGRSWALEHYSPVGLAKNFLAAVEMDGQ